MRRSYRCSAYSNIVVPVGLVRCKEYVGVVYQRKRLRYSSYIVISSTFSGCSRSTLVQSALLGVAKSQQGNTGEIHSVSENDTRAELPATIMVVKLMSSNSSYVYPGKSAPLEIRPRTFGLGLLPPEDLRILVYTHINRYTRTSLTCPINDDPCLTSAPES